MKTESEMDFTNRMKEYIDLSQIETKEELEEILRTTLNPEGKRIISKTTGREIQIPSTKQIHILLPEIGLKRETTQTDNEFIFTMVKFQYGERKVKRDKFGRFAK